MRRSIRFRIRRRTSVDTAFAWKLFFYKRFREFNSKLHKLIKKKKKIKFVLTWKIVKGEHLVTYAKLIGVFPSRDPRFSVRFGVVWQNMPALLVKIGLRTLCWIKYWFIARVWQCRRLSMCCMWHIGHCCFVWFPALEIWWESCHQPQGFWGVSSPPLSEGMIGRMRISPLTIVLFTIAVAQMLLMVAILTRFGEKSTRKERQVPALHSQQVSVSGFACDALWLTSERGLWSV